MAPSTPTTRLRTLPLALALLALSACQTMGPEVASGPASAATAPTGYPREAMGAENPKVFPDTVAGYRKRSVTLYAPGMVDYSIGYYDQDPATPNLASLYFYQDPASLAALFAETRDAVRQNTPSARLLTEYETRLTRNGRSYPARVATFSMQGPFFGQGTMLVYSKLLLVALPTPGHFFKMRQTGAIDTAGSIESHGQKLLEAIDWTYEVPEARPTLGSPNAT